MHVFTGNTDVISIRSKFWKDGHCKVPSQVSPLFLLHVTCPLKLFQHGQEGKNYRKKAQKRTAVSLQIPTQTIYF